MKIEASGVYEPLLAPRNQPARRDYLCKLAILENFLNAASFPWLFLDAIQNDQKRREWLERETIFLEDLLTTGRINLYSTSIYVR